MIALFVLKLCAGITMMWCLMPRKEVTDGFFRIQMRLVLGLAVLGVLLVQSHAPLSEASDSVTGAKAAAAIRYILIGMAVVAYFGSVVWALGRRLPGTACIWALALAGGYAIFLQAATFHGNISVFQRLLSDFSTAAVAGSVLTAMLLGHWYLTTPTMSINPLWWFNGAIVLSALARLVASTWAVYENGLPSGDSTQQIWLGIRWIGGVAAPLLMAVVVWRILKHRNTQSATGVLFAGLILVFMGEMTAALLERDTLVPY